MRNSMSLVALCALALLGCSSHDTPTRYQRNPQRAIPIVSDAGVQPNDAGSSATSGDASTVSDAATDVSHAASHPTTKADAAPSGGATTPGSDAAHGGGVGDAGSGGAPASTVPTAGAAGAPPLIWPIVVPDASVLDDDGGEPFPPPMDCRGKAGAPGNSTRMYGERAFIVHVPSTVNPNSALPVLFMFHGAGSNGADMQTATGFDSLADQLGFVTVYPNGAMGDAPWNVGRNVCPPGNFVSTVDDDLSYFTAMLDNIEADQCIDRNRVLVTGFSMGGYFANELGCQLGRTRIRAIAPHSGGTHSGSCPGAPLPVLILHGDSDSLINYSCGVSARDEWVSRNGCSSDVDTVTITGGHCDFNRNCPANGQVAMCTFNGMDHTWAYPPMYEFSSLLIGEFFAPYL
jgi:polyhydroxybutyrate depolymerase